MQTGNDFLGEPAWTVFHAYCANFDPKEKTDFYLFIKLFVKFYICPICREHFFRNMQNIDPRNYMNSAEDMLLWSYIMHDLVNQQKIKDKVPKAKSSPSFEQVKTKFMHVVGKSPYTRTTPLNFDSSGKTYCPSCGLDSAH